MGYKKQQHKAAKAKPRGGKAPGDGSGEQAAAAHGGARQKGGAKQQRRRGRREVYCGDDGLAAELRPLGLRVKAIDADGNCFFRSVCDQLEGEGGDHLELRARVLGFIEERKEEYALFMEDDEPFDSYVKRMKQEGAWAGNLELVAASLMLRRNIAIYQEGQPLWRIRNFPEAPEEETLHLSYHDGMHYNSVRLADDYSSGPPEPIRLRAAAAGAAAAAAAAAAPGRSFGSAEVDQVVAGTGCCDRERISRVLEQCGGSVDAAIELLVEQLAAEPEEGEEGEEEQASAEAAAAVPAAVQQGDAAAGAPGEQQQAQEAPAAGAQPAAAAAAAGQPGQPHQPSDDAIRLELRPAPGDPCIITAVLQPVELQQAPQQQEREPDDTAGAAASADAAAAADAGTGGKHGKRGVRIKYKPTHAGRNQRCPCGSKKKFKSCCGTGRSHAAPSAPACDGQPAAAAADGVAAKLQALDI